MFRLQVLLAIALSGLTIAADTQVKNCPSRKCPNARPTVTQKVEQSTRNVSHWTYPGKLEEHLQGEPHFQSKAELARMTHEQQLTLHDKLHQSQAQSKPGIATTQSVNSAALRSPIASPLGQAPNGASPEFIAFGVDAPCNLKRSMSTFRDSNCIPLGLVPPSSHRDVTGVPSTTRCDDSGGRNGRIHATALGISPGRPCPRPSVLSSTPKLRLAHVIQRLRSRR